MTIELPFNNMYQLWGTVGGMAIVTFGTLTKIGSLIEKIRADKYVPKEIYNTHARLIETSMKQIRNSVVTLAQWAERALEDKDKEDLPPIPFIDP